MTQDIYVKRFSAWAPGIESQEEWSEWAQGNREMQALSKSPELGFTDPMFRRRLSQISKMTIQVVHDLLPIDNNTHMFFLSFRGELSKQFSINKMMINDKALMPAAFSLSVFNAPIALASMALGLKGGYTALYPANNSFDMGFAAASAALESRLSKQTENNSEIVLVYADEMIPSEYIEIHNGNPMPLAFSLLLTKKPCRTGQLALSNNKNISPQDFLKALILNRETHATV